MSDRDPTIVNADPLDGLDCAEAIRAAFEAQRPGTLRDRRAI